MTRPFRFGANLGSANSLAEITERARRMEAIGYSVADIGDHVATPFSPGTVLTAAAVATTSLRVGCTVFANDFRHPALVAKEVASIDLLSGGRVECGIGAGWNKAEYDQLGIPFDPPKVRVDRLIEAVDILKQCWRAEPFSMSGTHYTIRELTGIPTPVQHPHPPLYIGGGGRRLLTFAARAANIVGILGQALPGGGIEVASMTDAVLAEKVSWVRSAAGERVDQLELNLLLWNVIVTDDRAAVAHRLAQAGATGGLAAALGGKSWVTAEEILDSAYFQIGTVEEIVEDLLALRERLGISYFTVFARDMEAFAPVVSQLAGR